MAFAFNQQVSADSGAEIAEINPETIGFSALSHGHEGAKKIKLLPNPWPNDSVPPASASLLAVASNRGLLAAAGTNTLVLASTENVRKAFKGEAGDNDVVTNFKPDITISVPRLRHVAFSSDEDYLVISAEGVGGLAVYIVDELLKDNRQPQREISTGNIPVRALLPNPARDFAPYFVVVLDSGRMDVIDIENNDVKTLRSDGVTCAAWSTKGKAFVAGLQDGTAIPFVKHEPIGVIPRPPGMAENYSASAVFWLKNEELFVIHSPQDPTSTTDDVMQEEMDTLFHFVDMKNKWTNFTFHEAAYPLLFPAMEGDAPSRKPPPRFSATRLREWDPILEDMLIVAGANSSDIAVLTKTSESIAPDQEKCNEFQQAQLIDSRKASVPRMSFGENLESVLIGEALDLSSKDKVVRPAPRLEEMNESPTPLPAYLVLTHEGVLAAWWIVWDKSLESGTGYHGLTASTKDENKKSKATVASTFGQSASGASTVQPSSPFAQPAATFGAPATPATPKFGTSSTPAATPGFGKPTQPAFGTSTTPATTPAFGKPAFGASSTPAATPAVGKPAQPAFGSTSKPGSSVTPAFGSASQIGGKPAPAFGATGIGNRQSPWGATAQTPASQPSASSFSSTDGGQSGFAKFGSNNTNTGSTFSSFGSNNNGQSGFSGLGQQRSAFSGASNAFSGLKPEPSFGTGSTITVESGPGSSLPSWANTPAQQGGSIFGQGTSSFGSTKESDMSDTDDAQNRQRDEATPTPQAPTPQTKNLFGMPTSGFRLESSFKGDGTAKDDEKPLGAADGFFGNAFGSTLAKPSTESPATPTKSEQQSSQDTSTTPATLPKPAPKNIFFPGGSLANESSTPKAAPSREQSASEDAPLPPDFMTSKPPNTDDDLPPLAGSPPIKVEAPSSSLPSSPIDDEDDDEDEDADISVEEDQDGDEETDEPSPSDAARRARSSQSGWTLQNSVNQPPHIFPAAPTPPPGRKTSPSRPLSLGQQFKSAPTPFSQARNASPLSFGQPAGSAQPNNGAFSKPPRPFAPSNGTQESLRSRSPVRATSTSAFSGTRREPLPSSGSSLSASVQQSKPPPPQPQMSDLTDDEDERIRRELESDIEPSRTLDNFLARQEYNGTSRGKEGHAAQIEIVYRDINNMVDTLGLNWRSLKSFLEYHERPQRYTELTRDALDEVVEQGEDGPWFEKWCLAETEDLQNLESELEQELDDNRVRDVLDKLSQLARLLHDKAKLMTKLNDVRRHIINRKDPDKIEAHRKASLPKELADQQKALRQEYARLLGLLSRAEEAVMLLRSRIASHDAENGKTAAVPTVEAVKRTINKLIMITEKKNNDIALLESQLRKVGLTESSRPNSSSSRHFGIPSRRSRAIRGESPLATPPANRDRMSLSELNRKALTPKVESTPTNGYGFYYTPEGSPTSGKDLASVADLVDNNLVELRAKAKRRRKVAEGLASALVQRGVKTTRIAQ